MLTYCVNRRPPPFELLSRLQSGKTPNKNRNNRPCISLILLTLRTLSLFPKWNPSIFNIPDDFFTLAKTPGGVYPLQPILERPPRSLLSHRCLFADSLPIHFMSSAQHRFFAQGAFHLIMAFASSMRIPFTTGTIHETRSVTFALSRLVLDNLKSSANIPMLSV
jgi:hypothetical protein